MTARKKSQDPSISSEERKNNMGALPHMAVLAGERPILVATPRVLVPKGVQVHRPPGNGHRASHHRPLANRPWRRHIRPTGHAQSPETRHARSPGTSHRTVTVHRAMPGHRKPGMPGHRAPATGRSPSTGQMGEKETSSLPITGNDHPVFGHWN